MSTPIRDARIVRAESADAPTLAATLAVSFLDAAPWSWIFPDRGERGRLLPRLLRLYLDDALEHDAVYTTGDRRAAAIWLPRAAHPDTRLTDEQTRFTTALGARRALRVRRYHALLDAARPAEAHDQLWAAVPPDLLRAGVLTRLLAEHHRVLDEHGRAAYVQVPDTWTRDRYLLQGYRARLISQIALPDPGGRVLHAMWRPTRWTPTLGRPVRVRDHVPKLGGDLGIVVELDPRRTDRAVRVAFAGDGQRPDLRYFAVGALEPPPAPNAAARAPTRPVPG